MGKCSLCGKTVKGRRRKCNGCKNINKQTRNTNTTFIEYTYSKNNEIKQEEGNKTKNDEDSLNESFIERLLDLNITGSDTEEIGIQDDQSFDFEVDSIHIVLNAFNIPQESGNLSIYTEPRAFNVKKKLFFKIGWIFFLNAGFQCNIITNYISDWKKIYKQVINNIQEEYKNFFFPILPVNLDKIVFSEHIGVFLKSLVATIDSEIILYGKGLKSLTKGQQIGNLLFCISKNVSSKGRIDISKALFGNYNLKFNHEKFKKFVDNHNDYKIGHIRLFTQQYSECCSIIATLKQNDKIIGEITCYYHNSIMYRKFFEHNRITIPSILGKAISDKCKYYYISKNNYIETLKEFANNCLSTGLIRRIELRLLNFDNIMESLLFFDFIVKNVDQYSDTLSDDFQFKYNIIYYYISNYELNNLLNDQLLFEELIRVFFLGLDSEAKNNMVDLVTIKLILIDIRNKYNVYLTNNILHYEIDFVITDSLKLNRIYNSLCRDKQLYSIIQYVCLGYYNNGFDVAKKIIRKIFIPQLLIDYLQTCFTLKDQLYTLNPLLSCKKYNIELFLRFNNYFESFDSIKKVMSTIEYNMRQGILPSSTLIGNCNVLRIRNREFSNKYSLHYMVEVLVL